MLAEPIAGRNTADGKVKITLIAGQRFRLELDPSSRVRPESQSCETSFSREIIECAIEHFPFPSLCSWIARHEDRQFISIIRNQLFGYFRPEEFAGKRLLDFGCGSGASTFAIAAVLPQTEIVGVDLGPERVSVARKIAEVQKIPNVSFSISPAGDKLPSGLGMFDFITLNAVYEHLLPQERRTLMPLLWAIMKRPAVLFVNQTPYRYFPYEHHSTGLWFINYLPDSLAHLLARKFARVNPQENRSKDWQSLLRGGIRGATEGEIIRNLLAHEKGKARILQPAAGDLSDRAGYWLANTNPSRLHALKRCIAILFRYSDRLWGTIPSLNLDVAIQKEY